MLPHGVFDFADVGTYAFADVSTYVFVMS